MKKIIIGFLLIGFLFGCSQGEDEGSYCENGTLNCKDGLKCKNGDFISNGEGICKK